MKLLISLKALQSFPIYGFTMFAYNLWGVFVGPLN